MVIPDFGMPSRGFTRVLQLVASSRGGGATYVRDLALEIDRNRFAMAVAMPEDGGIVGRGDFEPVAIPFHCVGIERGFSVPAALAVRRLAARTDILHATGARAALFARLAAASLGRRRPRVVYAIQGLTLPFQPPHRRLAMLAVERCLAPVTDAVIAVSEAERSAFLAYRTVPAERVWVIRNGVDPRPFVEAEGKGADVRREFGIADDTVVITMICRLYEPRDFNTLLGAFVRLQTMGIGRVLLLIVGEGPDRPRVEKCREELGLTSSVILAGQRRDVPALLAATDIFTLTTWGWEGLPFTVLEAMAAARPVVATGAGGTPEAVVDGETGLLVPPLDPEALAGALAALVMDPERRRRMGTAGRARVAALFSRDQMIERTTELYEHLVNLQARERLSKG